MPLFLFMSDTYERKIKKNISINDCDEFSGITPEKELNNIWNKVNNASIYEMNDLSNYVINNSININRLLKYFNQKILESNLSEQNKSRIIIEILNISAKLLEKSDEFLQILYLFTLFIN